jgi:hypothetical protein
VLWKRQLLEGVESVFDGPADRKDKAADEPQTAELYEQIGKLNMQLEWLKKSGRERSVRNVIGSIGNIHISASVSNLKRWLLRPLIRPLLYFAGDVRVRGVRAGGGTIVFEEGIAVA